MWMEDGNLTVNVKEKLDIFSKCHQCLYQLDSMDGECVCGGIASLLNSVKMLELQEEHKEALDAPLSLEEIHKAIAALRCNSSPGSDGLTPKFYLKN